MRNPHLLNSTPIPFAEINHRCSHLQRIFKKEEIDGVLIVQRVDLLYFSGTAQDGILYVPAEGEPVLFIKRYIPRARKESPLNQIIPIDSLREGSSFAFPCGAGKKTICAGEPIMVDFASVLNGVHMLSILPNHWGTRKVISAFPGIRFPLSGTVLDMNSSNRPSLPEPKKIYYGPV
jgi:hypothetical protein